MKFLAMTLSLSLYLPTLFAQEITIYDAQSLRGIGILFKPGKLTIDKNNFVVESPKKNIMKLYSNFVEIYNYHKENFGRDSWDDQGSPIEAIVNMRGILKFFGLKENAAWYSRKKRFLFGYGELGGLDFFEEKLDVVAHEYTHAIIDSSSKLKYEGQSGALNEHLADVFGVLVNKKVNHPEEPFLIGLGIDCSLPNKPLRNMANPAEGLLRQPAHMDELKFAEFAEYGPNCVPSASNDKCGVHILSGIPNKMAVHVIKNLGDQLAGQLFYHVMVNRLQSDSNFSDYAEALMVECQEYLSKDMKACDVVQEGLESVGML